MSKMAILANLAILSLKDGEIGSYQSYGWCMDGVWIVYG